MRARGRGTATFTLLDLSPIQGFKSTLSTQIGAAVIDGHDNQQIGNAVADLALGQTLDLGENLALKFQQTIFIRFA